MSDWQPQVVAIESIRKHPDADALEIATVLTDYPVITKTGDYKVGDLVCYIPIDSIVPDTDPFYFLCPAIFEKYEEAGELRTRRMGPKYTLGSVPEKYRVIKAKRIRGTYSQGMLMPLALLPGKSILIQNELPPEGLASISTETTNIPWGVGDQIIDALGLKKHEEEEEDNLPGARKTKGANAAKPPQGWSIPHYDIDGVRKYLNCLQENEEVVLTEKLHGCLESTTLVTMADFSKKKISQVKTGDMVLGRADDGTIVPSKVIEKFNNGRADEWLKITGKIKGIAKSGGKFVVTCTPEHRFWSSFAQQFVRATEMSVGDNVEYLTNDLELTPLQKQVVIGKILGDGNIRDNYLTFSHEKSYEDYIRWTLKCLGSIASPTIQTWISGFGSDMLRAYTGSFRSIGQFARQFYNDKRKFVPSSLVDMTTPIAIAFWYMDDGSLNHTDGSNDRAIFATQSFTDDDCLILIKCLEKFAISARIQKNTKNQNTLVLNADDAELMFLLIAPYIAPSMQYKLPERYRGATWAPAETANEYKAKLNRISISTIESFVPQNKTKHDLETETHNYFASGILVHNSNAAYCHDGEKLWVKSRNYYKKFDPDDMWHDIAIRYELESKLKQFPMLVFFGEVVGQVKGFRYEASVINGALATKLFVFDVFNESTKRYLDYDDKVAMIRAAGLDPVPELYRGPWIGKDKLYPLAEGMTTIGGKHLREGWVLNTAKERYEPRLDSRMQVKLVGEGYNLAKP